MKHKPYNKVTGSVCVCASMCLLGAQQQVINKVATLQVLQVILKQYFLSCFIYITRLATAPLV